MFEKLLEVQGDSRSSRIADDRASSALTLGSSFLSPANTKFPLAAIRHARRNIPEGAASTQSKDE